MIKIKPDREGLLTQWDLNRRIQITGLEDISNTEIHFSKTDDTKGAYVVLPVIENGIAFADIPNILLTVSGRIDVFVYRDDHTCVRGVFVVAPREKPDDYIYEETEVLKYEDFVERLDGLETQKEDKANRVTTVDDNSDDEHYPTAKAVYKAIPKSLKNPYSLTFTGAVTGSYDGSKPMTFNIPVGGSGTDISLGITSAAVGDIIKVKAVDDSGKPTAWEAAEYDGWTKIGELTMDGTDFTISAYADGVITVTPIDGVYPTVGVTRLLRKNDGSNYVQVVLTATETEGQYTMSWDYNTYAPTDVDLTQYVVEEPEADVLTFSNIPAFLYHKARFIAPYMGARGMRGSFESAYAGLYVYNIYANNIGLYGVEIVLESAESYSTDKINVKASYYCGNQGKGTYDQVRTIDKPATPTSITFYSGSSMLSINSKVELWGRN